MTSIIENIFGNGKIVRKKTHVHEEKVYNCDVSSYDDTFAVARGVLKWMGIRLTRIDTPAVRLCWNAFYCFEFLNLFVALCLELIEMVLTARGGSFQDATDVFRMMPCVGYLLMAMTKTYKIIYNRPVFENLVSELRAMWPQGYVSEEDHLIVETALRQLRYVIKGYFWCNNALVFIFLSPPILEYVKVLAGYDTPLILPFFFWFPFDPFQRGVYEIVLAVQTWHGFITIWFMVGSDLLFCIFLSHVTTQFDLLAVRIRRLVYVPQDQQMTFNCLQGAHKADYLSNDETMNMESLTHQDWERKLHKEITEIVLRHLALIRLSGDVESMYSFALLVNFINSSIVLCFCGFCVVIVEKWNELVYKSFLLVALSQTWLLCWYGQRLLDSSEGVSDALYNSSWYQASKKIKCCIIIMIQRSQKNVRVTTYGFSIICLSSYTTIMKSAWSYFTLLLNIYKR